MHISTYKQASCHQLVQCSLSWKKYCASRLHHTEGPACKRKLSGLPVWLQLNWAGVGRRNGSSHACKRKQNMGARYSVLTPRRVALSHRSTTDFASKLMPQQAASVNSWLNKSKVPLHDAKQLSKGWLLRSERLDDAAHLVRDNLVLLGLRRHNQGGHGGRQNTAT